jgi:RimJ/RimL family protein N-acetyltransferase
VRVSQAEQVTLAPGYPVRSARLLLRPVSPADVAAVVAYRSRPEVCRYVPFDPMDASDVRARLAGMWSRRTLDQEGQVLVLGAEVAASGELIGDLLLRWISAEDECGELGYVFHPAHGGRGYATEAAHAVLHLAFDDLRLHRVIARVDARNTPSARVAARLGMRQEGRLVENSRFTGEWSDELDFALLAREWPAQALAGCPACRRAR